MKITREDIWTTKDGTEIVIKNMTDSHLLNAIKFLKRKIDECPNQYGYPCFQGEIAQMTAEREYEHNEAVLEVLIKYSEAMEEEAVKRGLTPKE